MKNDFDNLILSYLSIYNESSYYNAPETCPTCESDIYDGECVNCGHSMDNESENSESSDYISKRYTPEWMAHHGNPRSLGPRPEGPTPVEAWERSPGGQREETERRKYLAMSDDEARAYLKQKSSEDNESEYGDHYHNDADSPRNNYGHSFKDGDYPDDVDYKDDDFNNSEDCPECGEEGCVDKNGYCHHCNLEDEEPESGREY